MGSLPLRRWYPIGILNLILLSLAVMVVAVPIGWLYGHLIPALQAGSEVIYHFSFHRLALVPAIAGGAALLFAFVWVVAVTANPSVNKILLGTSLALVGVVLAWLCFAVALPIVLEWLHRSVGSTPTGTAAAAPSSTTKALGAAAGTGTAASILIALLGTRVARTVKAGWDDVPKGIKAPLLQKGKNLLLRLRVPLINLLIFLIGPFTLLCLFLLGVHVGALYPAWSQVGRTWDPFFGALGGLGVAGAHVPPGERHQVVAPSLLSGAPRRRVLPQAIHTRRRNRHREGEGGQEDPE